MSTFNSNNEGGKNTNNQNKRCIKIVIIFLRKEIFFTSQHQDVVITLLSISGQTDTSPLHGQSPQLFPPSRPQRSPWGGFHYPPSPTTQHPSHHAIVQPNSTWDRHKRIGKRLRRGNVPTCVGVSLCVCVCVDDQLSQGSWWKAAAV